MRRVIGAGPRPAQGTGSTGLASCTCAGSARPGTGGRYLLRAGPSGRLATMHSHRRPVPQHAAARSRTRRSRWRRRRRGHQMTGRQIMLSRPWRSTFPVRSSARYGRARCTGMRCHQDKAHPGHPRSWPSSARPQRNHHRWPPHEHPGTLIIDALPAASNQTSGQQRRVPRRPRSQQQPGDRAYPDVR